MLSKEINEYLTILLDGHIQDCMNEYNLLFLSSNENETERERNCLRRKELIKFILHEGILPLYIIRLPLGETTRVKEFVLMVSAL